MTTLLGSTKRQERRFGWCEVSVSLLLVAVVLSMLLPAVISTRRIPRLPSIRMEIAKLEQAIAQFKVTYGVEPPSGIALHADQAQWDSDPRSRGLIRQIWPQFDFKDCGGLKDLPHNGIKLSGDECLVFFLGGLPHPRTGELNGFAKSNTHPFSNEVPNRVGPFFEFQGRYSLHDHRWIGRLGDHDGDGFPDYRDPLPQQTQPYLYASHYDGRSFRKEDLGGAMVDVYRNKSGIPFKPKGFQIISAGPDGKYGRGGLYDPENANAVLTGNRVVERDNVTNFMAGSLGELPNPRSATLLKLGGVNLIFFLLVTFACKIRGRGLLLLLILQLLASGILVLPMIGGVS